MFSSQMHAEAKNNKSKTFKRHVFRDSETSSKIKDVHSTEPHKQYQIQQDKLSSSVFFDLLLPYMQLLPRYPLTTLSALDRNDRQQVSIKYEYNLIYKHLLFPPAVRSRGAITGNR